MTEWVGHADPVLPDKDVEEGLVNASTTVAREIVVQLWLMRAQSVPLRHVVRVPLDLLAVQLDNVQL